MQVGTEKPRFRQDLFAEAVDEHGVKYIDVMDPDSGNAFRLYESEFSIACGMDGERDVAGLVQWAQDELGLKASANEVRTVIATLGELGYLDMAAATKAAASDVPAVTPAPTPAPVVEAPAATPPKAAAAASAAGPPAPKAAAAAPKAAATPPKAAAAQPPGTTSEVSLDLSEHLAVGKEDVKEAVRQSRVMSAIELPPELAEPAAAQAKTPARPLPAERPAASPSPAAAEAKQPERPVAVEAKQPERPVAVEVPPPERPVEVKQPERPVAVEVPPPERPVEVKQPERPVEVKQPERPVEVKQPERPVEVKQPERPVEVKQPKVPEKQPVPPGPERRVSPVLIVVILLILGGAAFAVWKLVLDKPADKPAEPVGVAPPPPPPPEPPPQQQPPSVTAKVEVNAGATKTILAVFAGTIEWVEANDKDVKSGDVIVKMAGYKPLEAQVAALKKEADKLQADLDAALQARDAAAGADEAAMKKLQAKVEAAEKATNAKAEQLHTKTEQIEKLYVRLTVDGKLTTMKKAGEKVPENTPVASVQPPPMASATFKVPPAMRVEIGLTTALRLGEKLLTCEVAESEEEKLRIICPQEPSFVEGATVSWQLPQLKTPG